MQRKNRFATMRLGRIVLLCLIVAAPSAAPAATYELSQSGVRSAVWQGRAISTGRVVTGVAKVTGGSVLELRAFDVDGTIIYRVIVQTPNGKLVTYSIDAKTGGSISRRSATALLAQELAKKSTPQAAASSASNSSSNSSNGSNGSNGNSGNGNSGSNGNSGNGNSGNGNGKGN